MNRLPPWIGSSTRPTPAEVERLVGAIDPELVRFARQATEPRPSEVAALRPRRQRTGVRPAPLFLAAAVGAAALGLLIGEPEQLGVLERPAEPGIYRVTAGDDLSPIHGVWIRGDGSVEIASDGRLVLEGDLLLTASVPVVFEVGDHRFSTRDAAVWVDPTGLRIAGGEVSGQGEVLTAGQRWRSPALEIPDRVVEVRAVPEPAPMPLPRGGSAPRPAPPPRGGPAPEPVPEAPAPLPAGQAPSAADAWREVLVRLEQGGTADDRIAALRSYRARYPDSPFDPEVEALGILILGVDGQPRERLLEIERWLGRHPRAARSVDLHALAARIAREGLRDCVLAEPHDRAVVEGSSGAVRAKGQAFLGLCAISSGRPEEGRILLGSVDRELLDPALRRAVAEALDERGR